MTRRMPLTTSNTMVLPQDWDRAAASCWLRASKARSEAFVCNNEMLLAAATVRPAEFELLHLYFKLDERAHF